MNRIALLALCIAVGCGGLVTEGLSLRSVSTPAVRDVSAAEGDRPSDLTVGQTFTVNIGASRHKLRELSGEERPEQVADWAVIGTLSQAGLSEEAVSKALFDKAPFRDPALEEVANFDIGTGRRVNLGDQTWLFRPEMDPHPDATLGRLADQARMELGAMPEQVSIFTYRSDLSKGQISVTLVDRVPGSKLFTPEAGYFERDVANAKELAEWLSTVDDVTYVALRSGQGVRLGGRRFERARTPGATLEDVAALYAAHRAIAQSKKDTPRPDHLVDLFNKAVKEANDGQLGTASETLGEMEIGLAKLDRKGNLGPTGSSRFSQTSLLKWRMDEARSRLESISNDWERLSKELIASGKLMPDEPGFSLDPQWDPVRLRRGLETLRDDPGRLIREAFDVVGAPRKEPLRGDAVPVEVRFAWDVVKVVLFSRQSLPQLYRGRWLTASQRSQIDSELRQLDGGQVEEAGLGVFTAANGPKQETESDVLFGALNQMIMARSQIQCARYDGPLKGTHVGMVLFYTDLLAKVWSSTDYHSSAPVEEVPGFRSTPRISDEVEPTYWAEMDKLRGTRVWFGPRLDTAAQSADQTQTFFSHIGARIYAAGSDPLHPGKESLPSEASRRVLGWWDHHYAAVADFEPQYHVQNQIMKWSVITGMLASHDRLVDLSDQRVDRSLRFDRWFASAKDLRYRQDVRLLPPERWLSGTECMELLASYSFGEVGRRGYILGGVSLGGEATLGAQSRISTKIAPELRRGGTFGELDGALKTVRGSKISFPEVEPGLGQPLRVRVQPAEAVRLRAGGMELPNNQPMELSFGASERGPPTSIGVKIGDAPQGRIQLVRGQGGSVQLKWADEVGAVERRVANALADAPSVNMARLQEEPALGRMYVRQVDGKVEAFSGGGGGGRGLPPGRARGFFPEPDRPGSALKVLGSDGKQGVSVAPMTEAEVHARLQDVHWQKVSASEAGGEKVVQRLFTDRGPSGGARRVLLEVDVGIHEAERAQIEAMVEGQDLYLVRPKAGRALKGFDDLVTSQRWTANFVEEVVGKANAGATKIEAFPRAVRPSERAADALRGGRPVEAARALAESAEGPAFEAEVQRMEEVLLRDARRDLSGGRSSPAARRFAVGDVSHPELRLGEALDLLEAQELGKAAKAVNAAPPIDPARLRAVTERLVEQGEDATEMGIQLQARSTIASRMADSALKDVHTEPVGDVLKTVGELKRPLNVKVIREGRMSAAAEVGRGDAVLYVEDGQLLTQKDWDFAPGRTLGEVAKDPHVVWEQVEPEELAGVSPARLQGGSGPVFERQSVLVPINFQGNVYRIHRCQPRAQATPEELQQCCDVDRDGTVSDEELKRCG